MWSNQINFFFYSLQVEYLPASKEQVIMSVYGEELDFDIKNTSNGRVYFVLEESSGYMGLCLNFLSLAHAIISFCCMIGYYCLKVRLFNNVILLLFNELFSLFKGSSFSAFANINLVYFEIVGWIKIEAFCLRFHKNARSDVWKVKSHSFLIYTYERKTYLK